MKEHMPKSNIRCGGIWPDSFSDKVDASTEVHTGNVRTGKPRVDIGGAGASDNREWRRKLSDAFFNWLRNLCL